MEDNKDAGRAQAEHEGTMLLLSKQELGELDRAKGREGTSTKGFNRLHWKEGAGRDRMCTTLLTDCTKVRLRVWRAL